MNIIEVDVGKTKIFSIGQQYNNNALAIHFVNLPNQKNKYIYYKIDDIEKEIPLVSDLFIVSRPLTLHSGEVKAQIIVRDETNETIELTKNFTMRIQPSNYSGIGEDENYPDNPNIKNYFVKIDEKVNSFEELANLVQSKLDNGDFVGEQGPKGEKGDPGDVTEEYRNLASQIEQNSSDAQTSATNAQTSASNAQKSFNDTKEFAHQTKAELNQIKTETNTLKDEANTSAVNAKASETKAKEYADNLQASTDDISQLKEDLSSVGQQAYDNKEEIANLTSYVNEKFLSSGLGILRTGKLYGTKVWKSAVNNSQTLEKTYDNAGLVCVPSTDTTVGQDDYADIPLFQWVRCTYKRYDDGFAYPIAVEGDGNYSEEGDVDCGSLMGTFYYKEIDNDDYTEVIISDSPNHALGLKPWEQAVRADGTVMPYFINSRYHSIVGTDGKLYSNRGRISRNQSHNNMITNYQKKGAGYWGAGSDRYTFAQIMMFIKYGTKSIQKVMAGVTNHNVQIKASIQSEEANTYFPVTNSQASSILVGTKFSVGYGTFSSSGTINADRGNKTIHAYADDVVVTAKVPMDDGVNTAIYLDCTAFNTKPITDSNGYTSDIYLSSMPAWSGDTDSVIGHHDGSSVSNTDGRHPCRIQGIEFMLGGCTVASDTVMFFKSDYSKDVYVAPRGVAHLTSDSTIQSTYTLVGNIPANNGSDFWIGDVNHVNGVWYPSTAASSNQYGMGDRCYAGGQLTSGSREYLQGGGLGDGTATGLSYLLCGSRLTGASWYCLSAD